MKTISFQHLLSLLSLRTTIIHTTVPDKLTFVDTFPDFPIVEVTEPDNYIVTELIHDYQIAYGAETFNKAKSALEAGDNEKFMKILLGRC